jgi:hypothetical protein
VVVLKQVLAGLLPKGHPAVQQVMAAAAAAGGGYAAPNKAVLISSIQVSLVDIEHPHLSRRVSQPLHKQ